MHSVAWGANCVTAGGSTYLTQAWQVKVHPCGLHARKYWIPENIDIN
jgi:hypothetical protein